MDKKIELFKAIASFQQECPSILKDSSGYGYKYADMPSILSVINPILKSNKLGFTQPIVDNMIKTIVFHTETGESIESEIALISNVDLKGMNVFQVLGSQITYLRRYALSSILGIVTDEDTDANTPKNIDQKPANQKPTDTNNKKPWLNPNTEAWIAAVNFIKDGNPISKIESKYIISKENREKLLAESI